MIARESVKARLESENGISFTEFSYQLLQANDYLHLSRNARGRAADRRLRPVGQPAGGVDLIRRADGRHVHAFTWPLLLRSDGKKFGKSEEGAVWLAADRTSPYQFFQYWMNVADADIERFLLQLTLLPVEECQRDRGRARRGAVPAGGPAPPRPGDHHAGARPGGDRGGRGGERDPVRRLPGGRVRPRPRVPRHRGPDVAVHRRGDAGGGPRGDPAGLVAVRRPPHDQPGRRLGQRRRRAARTVR